MGTYNHNHWGPITSTIIIMYINTCHYAYLRWFQATPSPCFRCSILDHYQMPHSRSGPANRAPHLHEHHTGNDQQSQHWVLWWAYTRPGAAKLSWGQSRPQSSLFPHMKHFWGEAAQRTEHVILGCIILYYHVCALYVTKINCYT